ELTFQQRAEGFPDDESIIEALLTRDDVAVIDSFALAGGDFFGAGMEDQFTLADPDGDGPEEALEANDEIFAPITVEIEGTDGATATLQIIGIIDSTIGSFFGLFAPNDAISEALPEPPLTSY